MRPPVKQIGLKHSSNFVVMVYRDGKPPDPLILQNDMLNSPLFRSYLLHRLVFRENSNVNAVLMPCDLSECSDHVYVPFSHLIITLYKYSHHTV